MRRMSGPEREELRGAGENYIMRSFTISILH
jgi:hypothetical protein